MSGTLLRALRRLTPPLLLGAALAGGCSDDTSDGDGNGAAASGGAGANGAGGSGASGGEASTGGSGGAASTCPAAEPGGRESCSEEGQVCEYGQECCCGECFPSYGCLCARGVWSCSYTDACFVPSCGGAGGEGVGRGGQGP